MMTRLSHRALALPLLNTGNALFCDLDGTLAELAPTPAQACVLPATLQALHELTKALNGAVAIISGRSLNDIDALCAPYRFPAIGQHGVELRESGVRDDKQRLMQEISKEIATFHQSHPRLLIEYKSMSVAVHYRQAPHLQDEVRRELRRVSQAYPALYLQEGKCVCEIRYKGADKGTAIHHLMQEAPFTGRQPVFIGDDVTDEDGFAAVNMLGGISIKVGQGESIAKCRLASVGETAEWLQASAKNLTSQHIRRNGSHG